VISLALAVSAAVTAAASNAQPPRSLDVEDLVEALQGCSGYDLTATANAARMHAEAFLHLIRAARERDAAGPPLRIGYAEWSAAYLRRTGLSAEAAPLFARLAFERGQETLIDYRIGNVLAASPTGRQPILAANVRTSWEEGPRSYSFVDALASPQLRVTNERLLTYRLLDFGEMIVFADVRGLSGRPVSGLLGALFDLIGEVAVVETRVAFAADGTQVARGRGKKGLLDVTQTVTIGPDGRAERGLPPSRPDLVELEERLKAPLTLRFVPLPSVAPTRAGRLPGSSGDPVDVR
jgi:hypothetical protein